MLKKNMQDSIDNLISSKRKRIEEIVREKSTSVLDWLVEDKFSFLRGDVYNSVARDE